jgi:hypothetical protein
MSVTTTTRYFTPADQTSTIALEIHMSSALHHGDHAHISLRSGVYGVNCNTACRAAGIREWSP